MGREREVGKAIPAATGTGLGLDSAALCHDLFRVCAGEVDAAPHMCGFDAARLMMPDIQVVLFVDHAFCQLTGRSRGAAERWLLRACGPRGGVCVLKYGRPKASKFVQKRPNSSQKKTRFGANDSAS